MRIRSLFGVVIASFAATTLGCASASDPNSTPEATAATPPAAEDIARADARLDDLHAVQPAAIGTKVVLGFRSIAGPAAAVFNGQLFLAFTGTDGNHTLNIANSSDGLSWPNVVQFGTNHSFDAPALAAFNGKLYIAWTSSVAGGSKLNIASSTDGLHFSNQQIIGDGRFTSAHGVTLAAQRGKLYLGWVGTDGTHPVNVISSADGVNWPNVPNVITTAPIGSNFTPALGTFGSLNVFLGWTRVSLPEDPINRLELFPIDSITGQTPISGLPAIPTGVNSGPGLGSLGNELFLPWIGPGLSRQVHVAIWQVQSNGTLTFTRQLDTPEGGVGNPTAIGFNGHAYFLWTGNNAGQNVNVDRFE